MIIAHARLHGLDENRVLSVVGPVLRAHGVEGVELIWRTDQGGWVLELTVERPGSRVPGEGITIDLCGEISRDLSAALDVADVIPARYRLEVGSPGLDRALYGAQDYERFAGQSVKFKLKQALDGQRVIRGTLHGLDDNGLVVVETERGLLSIELSGIENAQLEFAWNSPEQRTGRNHGRRASGRGHRARGSQR